MAKGSKGNTVAGKNTKYDNKGDEGGFNKGSEPSRFGPDDFPHNGSEEKNKIGGTPEAKKKYKQVDESVLDYTDKMHNELNAVPRPNKKGKEVNKGILGYIGDSAENHDNGGFTGAVPIGGHSMPNNIS